MNPGLVTDSGVEREIKAMMLFDRIAQTTAGAASIASESSYVRPDRVSNISKDRR